MFDILLECLVKKKLIRSTELVTKKYLKNIFLDCARWTHLARGCVRCQDFLLFMFKFRVLRTADQFFSVISTKILSCTKFPSHWEFLLLLHDVWWDNAIRIFRFQREIEPQTPGFKLFRNYSDKFAYTQNKLQNEICVFSSLFLHRASCRFTNYHTTNKCTNCMSFIFKPIFKTLSLLLHVSIAYRLSSSGRTYSSQPKSRVKNTNFFFIILLWQHILYLCALFLVQGGKWICCFHPLILKLMYLCFNCLFLHIWLNNMAALFFSNFSLVFLQMLLSLACWALIIFIVAPCILQIH